VSWSSAAPGAVAGNLPLGSISFLLAFKRRGRLLVFAKAGAEATVEVTFTRKVTGLGARHSTDAWRLGGQLLRARRW